MTDDLLTQLRDVGQLLDRAADDLAEAPAARVASLPELGRPAPRRPRRLAAAIGVGVVAVAAIVAAVLALGRDGAHRAPVTAGGPGDGPAASTAPPADTVVPTTGPGAIGEVTLGDAVAYVPGSLPAGATIDGVADDLVLGADASALVGPSRPPDRWWRSIIVRVEPDTGAAPLLPTGEPVTVRGLTGTVAPASNGGRLLTLTWAEDGARVTLTGGPLVSRDDLTTVAEGLVLDVAHDTATPSALPVATADLGTRAAAIGNARAATYVVTDPTTTTTVTALRHATDEAIAFVGTGLAGEPSQIADFPGWVDSTVPGVVTLSWRANVDLLLVVRQEGPAVSRESAFQFADGLVPVNGAGWTSFADQHGPAGSSGSTTDVTATTRMIDGRASGTTEVTPPSVSPTEDPMRDRRILVVNGQTGQQASALEASQQLEAAGWSNVLEPVNGPRHTLTTLYWRAGAQDDCYALGAAVAHQRNEQIAATPLTNTLISTIPEAALADCVIVLAGPPNGG